MVRYNVTVFTADVALATTFNNVFIKLVGTDGESECQRLMSLKGPAAFMRAAVGPSSVFPLAGLICLLTQKTKFQSQVHANIMFCFWSCNCYACSRKRTSEEQDEICLIVISSPKVSSLTVTCPVTIGETASDWTRPAACLRVAGGVLVSVQSESEIPWGRRLHLCCLPLGHWQQGASLQTGNRSVSFTDLCKQRL